MTSTENDALHLANQPVGSAGSLSLDSFTFNYLSMDDTATLTASLQYVYIYSGVRLMGSRLMGSCG
jgi:hypothetical protein